MRMSSFSGLLQARQNLSQRLRMRASLSVELLEDRSMPSVLVPGAPPAALTPLDSLPAGSIVSNGGTVSSISFTALDNTGTPSITATVYFAVYKETATGFLDFLFQVQSSQKNSQDAMLNTVSTNFSKAASFLDADFLQSGAVVPHGFLQVGAATPPSSALLSTEGATVTFNYATNFGPGSLSNLLLLRTHVTGFSGNGSTTLVTPESRTVLATFSPGSGSTGSIAAASGVAGSLAPAFAAAPVAMNLPLVSKAELFSGTASSVATGAVGADAGFVMGLYENLLNRTPGVSEVTFWVQMLMAGISRDQVATDIWRSPEHRQVEVDQYYATYLGRAADAAGQAFWVNDLLAGDSEVDVALKFLTSAEYMASHTSDLAFLTGIYSQVLGRTADATGEAGWLQALQSGASRAAVVQAFLTSAESQGRVVVEYYNLFLNRSPSSAEQQAWVSLLVSNQASVETVGEAFLASDEYFARMAA